MNVQDNLILVVIMEIVLKAAAQSRFIDITGYAEDSISMPCNHKVDQDAITLVGWTYDRSKDPFVKYKNDEENGFALEVKSEAYAGRVSIKFPSGDLVLQKSLWSDRGEYECIIIDDHSAVHTGASFRLDIYVLPSEIDMKCATDSTYIAPKKNCLDIDDNFAEAVKSISCSVSSNPQSSITWIVQPMGCGEDISNYCTVPTDSPKVCVSQLKNTCTGDYQCQVTYTDGSVSRNIVGDKISVYTGNAKQGLNGHHRTDNDQNNSVSLWRLIVGLVAGIVLLVAVIISIYYYRRISKRFRDPSIVKDKDEPSCFLVVCCPCQSNSSSRRNKNYNKDDKSVRFANQKKETLLNESREQQEEAVGDTNSDEDSPTSRNKFNSLTKKKQIRPEIYQAVKAAKALMDGPETERCKFMVQTIGGTKYKFEVEKKASNEDLPTAGNGEENSDDFLHIKGPVTEKQHKINVDDVD